MEERLTMKQKQKPKNVMLHFNCHIAIQPPCPHLLQANVMEKYSALIRHQLRMVILSKC